MILGALADAGGQQYLVEQASKNPAAFMQLIGKVLPTQITGGGPDDQPVSVSFRWADATPADEPPPS